eukprot:scaffold156539_cov26-Tisochrysis_lutea.AAC.8
MTSCHREHRLIVGKCQAIGHDRVEQIERHNSCAYFPLLVTTEPTSEHLTQPQSAQLQPRPEFDDARSEQRSYCVHIKVQALSVLAPG